MIYAQITNNIIVNTIVLDDSSLVSLFSNDINGNPYDSIMQIDNISPQPAKSWYYDTISTNFYPPATLAIVQNNTVIDIIHNCAAYIINNSANFQAIIDITSLTTQPQIGYIYNGSTFSAPPPPASYYQNLVVQAINFGNNIIIQAAGRNISMGITQAGKTIPVMNYCADLVSYLTTGSLYAALTQINTMIADTSDTKANLSPFITNDTLYTTLNQIQDYLGIPETPNPGP